MTNSLFSQTVRLRDIAERAHVSRATVSLALRDHPSISRATRTRIQKIATGLSYRPNPLISALMKYQRVTRLPRQVNVTLAIILQSRRTESPVSRILPAFLAAAHRQADQRGYRSEEFYLDDPGMNVARLDQILFHRSIPGVVVTPLAAIYRELNFDWSRLCGVAIGTTLASPRLDRVDFDCFEAMRVAVSHLREMGYRRIGFASKNGAASGFARHYGTAYLVEQQDFASGERLRPFLSDGDDWSEHAFAEWCRDVKPDVVLGQGEELFGWLEKVNETTGTRISFANLSASEHPGRDYGIACNVEVIASTAIDLLVERVEANKCGAPESPKTVLLQAQWVVPKSQALAATTGCGM